jgi:hypothetical protein
MLIFSKLNPGYNNKKASHNCEAFRGAKMARSY